MTTVPTSHDTWRKSSYSSGTNTCVEVPGTLDRVRDSKNTAGPVLAVSVRALVAAVRSGQITR